jgi:hypothetical protein
MNVNIIVHTLRKLEKISFSPPMRSRCGKVYAKHVQSSDSSDNFGTRSAKVLFVCLIPFSLDIPFAILFIERTSSVLVVVEVSGFPVGWLLLIRL